MHAYVFVCASVHVHICLYVCEYACMHLCVFVHVCVCVCVCVCICVYVYVSVGVNVNVWMVAVSLCQNTCLLIKTFVWWTWGPNNIMTVMHCIYEKCCFVKWENGRKLFMNQFLFICMTWKNGFGLVVRVFANGPGDLGSISSHVIPKTLKMVLDSSLLST